MTLEEGTSAGRVIDGRYRIVRTIADGGMATVYKAEDMRLTRPVAIKIMHTQLAQGPYREQFVERFHREVRAAASLANAHIVQVYDTGQHEGLDYLVMQYVHGVNLRHEMNRQGVFDVRETLRLVGEMLEGLSAAHDAGVVHRDIKPENIMINDRGHAQITDFGLAKAMSQATLSTTGMLLGTAAYLAPEMIERNEATPQGDLYAVGIIAYEMLTGSAPFASDNPVTTVFKHVHEDVPRLDAVCPGIERSVADFVVHLTARAIDGRPSDAGEALRELDALMPRLSPQALHFKATLPALATGSTTGSAQPARSAADHRRLRNTGSRMPSLTAPPPAPDPPRAKTRRLAGAGAAASDGNETVRLTRDAVSSAEPDDSDGSDRPESSDRPGLRVRRHAPIAIALGAVLALVAAATIAWWYFLGPGSYWSVPAAAGISCQENQPCPLKGADFARFESTLKAAGIPYTISKEFSDTVAEGRIVSAEPGESGAHVSKRGGTMRLIVSRGVRQATVPSGIGDPDSQAGSNPLQALKDAGFSNIRHDEDEDQYSQSVPEGAAISVTPGEGVTQGHDQPVTVVLSKGPMPVDMPKVEGTTKAQASGALEQARLKVTFVEQWSDTVGHGMVISANVKAGATLHWGDPVTVTVSKGPQMVTVPDVRQRSEDEARKTLEGLGLEVKISAPLGNLTHTVRLQNPDAGKQVRLRGTDGKPTVVTLVVV